MRTHIYFLLVVSLALASSGCGKKGDAEVEDYTEKITNVEFFKVEPTRFEENITLPVVVLPFKEVNLGMTNGGRITTIHIDKGQKVRKGQLLLETDDTILKALYELSKASLDYQKNEFVRSEKLFKNGSITEAAYDGARLASAQAQSSFDMAKKNYEEATLKAPLSGIVTMRNVEVGDILGPGTPAFRIIEMSKVKVQAGIPEKYIVDFTKGNKAKITFDAIPEHEFEGIINYIAPEASPQVRTFLAEMIVDNGDDLIRAGEMGNAQILRKVYENALLIPINALIETRKGLMVFVLKEGNIVEERFIKMVGGNDLMTMSVGLSAGEKIITRGHYDLIDGEQVNVTGEYNRERGEAGS